MNCVANSEGCFLVSMSFSMHLIILSATYLKVYSGNVMVREISNCDTSDSIISILQIPIQKIENSYS